MVKATNSNSNVLEKDLSKQVKQWLKANKIYTLDLEKTGAWSGKGKPDLVICLNGQFVALELKVGKNKEQPDQRIHKNRIIASGGKHFSPRTFKEFLEIMEELR